MKPMGLIEQAAAMGVPVPESATAEIDHLLQLLAKWNRVYNLTSLRDESTWVSHHILDSLSIVPFLSGDSLVDVGSGAGFPGFPIAIATPGRQVTLLDSSQKKSAFLRHAVGELGLSNVSVETSRVEAFEPKKPFDIVASRAFSNLAQFARMSRHLCAVDGKLVAMKGGYPEQEIKQLPSACIDDVVSLRIPGLDAQRHAVMIDPAHVEANR